MSPVMMQNDVVAPTEVKCYFGLGRGIDDLAVVTTGTGVGYGLVIHGRRVITPDTGLDLRGHFPPRSSRSIFVKAARPQCLQ